MMELFVPRLGKARITSIKEPGINEQKVNTNFPRITALAANIIKQAELGARGQGQGCDQPSRGNLQIFVPKHVLFFIVKCLCFS